MNKLKKILNIFINRARGDYYRVIKITDFDPDVEWYLVHNPKDGMKLEENYDRYAERWEAARAATAYNKDLLIYGYFTIKY